MPPLFTILYPMFDRTAPVSGLACGYGFFNIQSPIPYGIPSESKHPAASSNVLPGTVIEIYGRK